MNKQRYEYLKSLGIINGCGGKQSINFGDLVRRYIQDFEEFRADKLSKLIEDVELKLCSIHDVNYHNGNTFFHRFIADLKFSIGLYKLLNWTSFTNRAGVSILAFILLLRFGGKYFNYGEKKFISIK